MAEFKIVQTRSVSMPRLKWKPNEEHLFHIYWRNFIEPTDYFDPNRECVVVILLNSRDLAIGHHLVSIGTLTHSLTAPREVFRAAVVGAADSIIMMHNHPSGEVNPSALDIEITHQLLKVGEILEIRLRDHLIVTDKLLFSFRVAGLI